MHDRLSAGVDYSSERGSISGAAWVGRCTTAFMGCRSISFNADTVSQLGLK